MSFHTTHLPQSLTCDLIQIEDIVLAREYNISVSKFCCPVCWELLEVLSETNDNLKFVVRSHHCNLYPVCLPPWLPDSVLEKMIERFKKKLYDKLCELRSVEEAFPKPFIPGHYKNPSLESAGESLVSSVGSADTSAIFEDSL